MTTHTLLAIVQLAILAIGGRASRSIFSHSMRNSCSSNNLAPAHSNAAISMNGINGGTGGSATRNLRGYATSRPCCVSWEPNRVDCFVLGPKFSMLHKAAKKDDDCCKCGDWDDLGGRFHGDIECVSRDVGYLDILVGGSKSELYIKSFSPDGWNSWVNKGGWFDPAMSCAVRDKSTINCLMKNEGSHGFQISMSGGVWGAHSAIGGTVASPMACSSRTPEVFDCFAVGWNDVLTTKYIGADGKWGGWTSFGGAYQRDRPTVTWNANRMDVFVLGHSGEVIQKTWEGNWKSDVGLGGMFSSTPDCVMTPDGRIICLGVGYKSEMFKNTFDGIQWSGWTYVLGHVMPETPSCVVSDRHTVSCYARTIDYEIMEIDIDA